MLNEPCPRCSGDCKLVWVCLPNSNYRRISQIHNTGNSVFFNFAFWEVRLGRKRLARCLANKIDELKPFVNGVKYYMRLVGFSPTVKTVDEMCRKLGGGGHSHGGPWNERQNALKAGGKD